MANCFVVFYYLHGKFIDWVIMLLLVIQDFWRHLFAGKKEEKKNCIILVALQVAYLSEYKSTWIYLPYYFVV